MSDSGSEHSYHHPTRMLERRVSNNRSDLSGDGQINYFLGWFGTWSELQKADFVAVLANMMTSGEEEETPNGIHSKGSLNGLTDAFKSMDCDSARPPSLFSCQVKLFRDWFTGWSDDQKTYLVLRLKDLDSQFFGKYEDYVAHPNSNELKDYFEPGFPDQDRSNSSNNKNNNNTPVVPPKINGRIAATTTPKIEEEESKEKKEEIDEEEDLKKGLQKDNVAAEDGDGLTTIKEDR